MHRISAIPVMAAAALLLGLSACAPNPTPYQPAGTRGFGYGEQQLEGNRFRVYFSGNADTPRMMVENSLLYRAAELTKARGYDYFIVVGQSTEPKTRYSTTYDNFGGFGGWYGHGFGVGAGLGTGMSIPVTDYSAYADIVIMKGKKAADDPHAYSADAIMTSLGPTLLRP